MDALEAVEELRQPFQGNPVPLDTEPVPVETGSDTPSFAHVCAEQGQNPRHMSLDFENLKSLRSKTKCRNDFFDSLSASEWMRFFYKFGVSSSCWTRSCGRSGNAISGFGSVTRWCRCGYSIQTKSCQEPAFQPVRGNRPMRWNPSFS